MNISTVTCTTSLMSYVRRRCLSLTMSLVKKSIWMEQILKFNLACNVLVVMEKQLVQEILEGHLFAKMESNLIIGKYKECARKWPEVRALTQSS